MKHLYPKSIFFLLTTFLFSTYGNSQNGRDLWGQTAQSKSANSKKLARKSTPKKALEYSLNIEGLKTYLKNAPKREAQTTSDVILNFPVSNGNFEEFKIQEASVLHPDLQAKMPDSRSYIGKSIENPENTIRFSITPQGLHTMLMSADQSTQFIDPISFGENDYLVYSKTDLPQLEDHFSCEVISKEISGKSAGTKATAVALNDGFLRTYRLAIASTIEYSEFHWGAAGLTSSDTEADKKNAVMNAMIVTMTRVNGVYERELSVTMQFVADNENLIFIDSDSFTNNDDDLLINESQTQIDNIIGNGNYDIGHTFSTGAGGLAELGSVCRTTSKARGVTGSSSPVGDAYDIDYVAHELGHQFGAPHTFNSVLPADSNCSNLTRSTTSAYEPGGGTTIMAYAGICSPDNIQANSDDYFHINSLQLIWNHINSTNGSCATETTSGNAEPEAIVDGTSYTIPQSTPYKLSGSSTDADGIASHTYTWEQYDLGNSGLPYSTNTTGPLVRSYQGTTNSTRYIPNLKDLSYFNGSTTWEKLASVDRDINFKLIVRDNEEYGRIATADMTVTTVTAAGPFVVTSQNTSGISWTEGSTQTITWDVAGTTGNGVNTAKVNILLSTDGGLTYPTTLASSVDNDGSEDITVPNVTAQNCRIMIEADGNIFFAINIEDFAIGYTVTKTCTQYSASPNASIPDNATAFEYSTINVSPSTTITDINVGVDITHTYKGDLQLGLISPTNQFIDLMKPLFCATGSLIIQFDDNATAMDCNNTVGNESYLPLESLSDFNGEDSSGNWTLAYADLGANDTGVLNSWYIEICTTTTEPLSVTSFTLDELKVFPNPNNGEFTLKLAAASQEVNVEVYDIRGRRIYEQAFEGNGSVNENINLNHAQSGMYILNVTDGFKQATRKIIIE
ncbi:reprolysin-like metallopeptidase [Algibacter sp. L4_22]|uniref:zinc-dependent metalloprotease n=1 Tax=Algibacter sp. L4_22 TaxID=2942477 RepID=UPI00201B6C64|nr:zinc-dependent metalloprotease family protein [Algibacter sp. L4_22]MCL5127078.1 M12 family metallo-peptidase [Algibacter sp. L4_22]